MKKNEVLKLVDEKAVDLKSVIAKLKVSEGNENTRNTQLYARKRERRVIGLIRSLVDQLGDEIKLSDDERDTLVLITTLSTERAHRCQVSCKAGDDIVKTLQKYQDVKNISEKLNKFCEKNGLYFDFKSGLIAAKPTEDKPATAKKETK